MPAVLVIGQGRLGASLVHGFKAAGVQVRSTSARNPWRSLRSLPKTKRSIVILAVADGAISAVAHQIASHLPPHTVVAHCAGSRGLHELADCRAKASIAVAHPLVSFADREKTPRLHGATWVLQGDRQALLELRRLIRKVGGRTVVAAIHGPLYHAAAALSANGAVALSHVAIHTLVGLGLSQLEAQRAIAALLHSVADNIERIGTPAALTGPIARGDAQTVLSHRQALRKMDRKTLCVYDAIAPAILEVAISAGLSHAKTAKIKRSLEEET